ncbi:hypothetical protein A11A3_06126 [Alcanivorax hongdengensis A-11-3]|uniref:DUF4129 domain-containing protein n=1 Tax=Alcanivorax hongdengensis A-11-3 TaxID=1177179 RepID=L0WDV3_9GAMM|nr:DUF4129 domain-containing protein [Alcanivorax hongdengensis]EKF75008.1 hypothetical protein A11A3_06126 [Alcanivorax hongdengensis A-11-3]
MELEKANARLAPRGPWQAVDLGTRLYRHWAGPVTLIWLAMTALPFAALLGVSVQTESLWPILLFWWLKPLWERPVLAFYSHALFNETLAMGAIFRRLPSYARNGLIGQLTWRRLSPWRSFNNNVWQLEGARGDQANQRMRVLASGQPNRAAMLTLIVLHLEQFMTLGLLALLYMLIPWQFDLELSSWFFEQGSLQIVISCLCWYLVMVVTEPLYVACGFALYLNKRTWLEGWDLQLGLTRIGRRRGMLAIALLLLLPVLNPQPARADDQPARQQAIEVLAGKDFMPMEEAHERRWKDQSDSESDWMRALWKWLMEHKPEEKNHDPMSLPDGLIRTLAWLLFIAVALWLIIRILRYLDQGGTTAGRKGESAPPTHVAGLDIRQQSLPDNLTAAINQALQANDIRTALSLLLRAVLADLLPRYPVRVHRGTTEQQCLRALRQQHGEQPLFAYLARLVDAWVRTAWAHRPVEASQVRELLDHWQQLHRGEHAHA